MSKHPENSMPPTLGILQSMAITEDWGGVDAVIGNIADNTEFLDWVPDGIENEDGNLRDLAVSLIEKSSTKPKPEIINSLHKHMAGDENPYVQFRSAFALFRHGDRGPKTLEKIKEALTDNDVADIAESYLNQQ